MSVGSGGTGDPADGEADAARPGRAADRIWFAHALRGIAALVVVWEHLFVGWWHIPVLATLYLKSPEIPPTPAPADLFYLAPFEWLAQNNINLAQVGVATFFVISGFVIPMSLERYSVGRYLVGRVFRLYPVWIAATVLAGAAFAVQAALQGTPEPFSAATWVWNALLVNDLVGYATANPVTWTLLIELKFYLLCALLAVVGGTRRIAPIAVSLVALTALALSTQSLYVDRALAGQDEVATVVFALGFSAPFICFMFIGVAIHNAFRGHWSAPTSLAVGAAALGAHAVGLFGGVMPDVTTTLFFVSFCAGLALFLAAYALRAHIPRSRVLDRLAHISYPLYATHYVVGGVLSLALFRATGWALASILVSALVVFALSWAVNRWIEEPANRYGKRVRLPRPRRLGEMAPAPEPVAAGAVAIAALPDLGTAAAAEQTDG
ncbi:MAG: acyltransferase [Miltoncostaeaceae bacterium]